MDLDEKKNIAEKIYPGCREFAIFPDPDNKNQFAIIPNTEEAIAENFDEGMEQAESFENIKKD